jgi:hypothetical protein
MLLPRAAKIWLEILQWYPTKTENNTPHVIFSSPKLHLKEFN